MNENDLRPEPPEWALDAGLPKPEKGEGFFEYVTRLGLDPGPLLIDLNDRTMCMANLRLAHALKCAMPHVWDLHVDKVASWHIPPERRDQIEKDAKLLFGDRFRRPMRDVSLPPS